MKITEARARSEAFVHVYCDDASHPRRVAVTNFARTPTGWVEVPASRAGRTQVGTGRTLLDDEPAPAGWALGEVTGTTRDRHELVCRRCKRRPVPVQAVKLHDALDQLAASGVSEVSLAGMAAIVASAGRDR